MKLYYIDKEKNEKTFDVMSKVIITPRLKLAFIDKFRELKEDSLILKNIELAKKLQMKIEGENQVKYDTVNIGDMLEYSQLQKQVPESDVIQNNDKIYIELLKIIIDEKSLNPEFRVFIQQDVDSDFWQSQDINEVISEVSSFRNNLKF
jgi:hypothetical protein